MHRRLLKWVILPALQSPRLDEQYTNRVIARVFYCRRIRRWRGLKQVPGGAFYIFLVTHPRWASDDKQFVLNLLHEKGTHGPRIWIQPRYGRGFVRWILPKIDVLEDAFDRIERFLSRS